MTRQVEEVQCRISQVGEHGRYEAGITHEVCEVGDSRQRLTDDEFEGDGGKEENERELKAIFWFRHLNGERRERETADEELHCRQNHRQIVS